MVFTPSCCTFMCFKRNACMYACRSCIFTDINFFRKISSCSLCELWKLGKRLYLLNFIWKDLPKDCAQKSEYSIFMLKSWSNYKKLRESKKREYAVLYFKYCPNWCFWQIFLVDYCLPYIFQYKAYKTDFWSTYSFLFYLIRLLVSMYFNADLIMKFKLSKKVHNISHLLHGLSLLLS